jgi:hypothetical protein
MSDAEVTQVEPAAQTEPAAAEPPAAEPTRRPDAAIYHASFLPPKRQGLDSAKALFASMFGSPSVLVVEVGEQRFARPFNPAKAHERNPDLLFPDGHPNAKEERYEWFEAIRTRPATSRDPGEWAVGDRLNSFMDEPDGVKFGYLKDDPYAVDGDVMAAVERELAERLAKRMENRAGGPTTGK